MPNTALRGVLGSRLTFRRDICVLGALGANAAIATVDSAIVTPIARIAPLVIVIPAAMPIPAGGIRNDTPIITAATNKPLIVLPTANTPAFIPHGAWDFL